jgi:hypothetical protein
MYAAPGLGLAAAAAVAVVLLVPHAQPLAFALEVTAEGSAVVRSGQVDERVVGDAVHITASSTKPHLAVRVYRDDIHLVISCPEHPTCRGSKDSIAVDFTIAEVGTYLVLAATADDALPALSGTFDADFAALTRAGVLEHQRKLIVR